MDLCPHCGQVSSESSTISGMWLHIFRAAHRVRNDTLLLLVPTTCCIDDPDDDQHDGYLDQYADNRRQVRNIELTD